MPEKNSRSPKCSMAPAKLQKSWAKMMGIRIADGRPKTCNFYGFMETVAWIWRLFAIFPITLKGPIGMERYGLNKIYAAYSFLMFAIVVINFTCGLLKSGHYFRHHLPMTSITIIIRAVASMLCMMQTSFWRIIHSKKLLATLNDISKHDLILEHLGCRCNYESSAKTIRRFVWTTLTIFLFFSAYDFVTTVRGRSTYFRWIFWMVPLFSQIMDLTILVSVVGWLGLKFRAVNEKISTVVTRANASSPKVVITSNVCADNLRVLSKAHFNICTMAKRVNRIFDWNIVINVMTAFIILSTTLYYIFFEIERKGETDMKQIFTYIHWEFMQSSPIIVIIIICNWTSLQGNYAGKLIHEIRVEKMDSRLYEAVKSFSLQLHHQKLQFTAKGFFPLNSTLLQTMVGKITTYLVILIQFQPNLDDLLGRPTD